LSILFGVNTPQFVNQARNSSDTLKGLVLREKVETKKLSEFEAAVINAVELNAEISLKEVALDLGKSVSTTRACLARLEENKLLQFYPLVNVFRLGYSIFTFYFNPVRAHEDSVIATLRASDTISWLARYDSDAFRYCASFVCKTPLEFQRGLEDLGREHGTSFHSSSTLIQTSLTMFKSNYLGSSQISDAYVTVAAQGSVVQVDDIDRVILSGILKNTYSSIRELARQVELPPSTVSERVNALKENGAIERFIYIANISAWGMAVYAVALKACTLHPDLRRELFDFCQRDPRITVFVECFGAWDFELNIDSSSRDEVDAIVDALAKRFGKLLKVVGTLKREEQIKLAGYPFRAPAHLG
jgi:Lrp/AsnC family transcriptional regulator for asnA, asnC and gidA